MKAIYDEQMEKVSKNKPDCDVIDHLREEIQRLASEKIQSEECLTSQSGEHERLQMKVGELKQKRSELE